MYINKFKINTTYKIQHKKDRQTNLNQIDIRNTKKFAKDKPKQGQ